ncbi:MAG TPA: DNA-3-methyladenine glycosylase I [Candidatus Saccharimonadia bacterium]|jgi:DNA-3-methyladenine glycosylase I
MAEPVRCSWVGEDKLMIRYHDDEWGTPAHDDRKLFEYMVLDAFQAGLSWRIVLHKRLAFDSSFVHFEPSTVVTFGEAEVERLMNDAGIIRNRAKIVATINNAARVLEIVREFGSLDQYLWGFVGGRTLDHAYENSSQIGATSPESDAMSRDLKARGFKFMGSTVCYAFMQGAGMVNDHLVSCFRYDELTGRSAS